MTEATKVNEKSLNKNDVDCLLYLVARNGYLDILDFLYTKGFVMDEDYIGCAARNGKLEVLKYLHHKEAKMTPEVANNAAEKGHLPVVEWLYGVGVLPDQDGLNEATGNGHQEIVLFVMDRSDYRPTDRCLDLTIVNGHYKMVDSLYAMGYLKRKSDNH